MGQSEYKPVEKVGSEVYEAGSPLTLDNGEFAGIIMVILIGSICYN